HFIRRCPPPAAIVYANTSASNPPFAKPSRCTTRCANRLTPSSPAPLLPPAPETSRDKLAVTTPAAPPFPLPAGSRRDTAHRDMRAASGSVLDNARPSVLRLRSTAAPTDRVAGCELCRRDTHGVRTGAPAA